MRYIFTLAVAVSFGFGTLLSATDTIQKQKEKQLIQELQNS